MKTSRWLLPFTYGVDIRAIDYAVRLAGSAGATVVPVSLVSTPSKGARLEHIQQSKDFLEAVQHKAARHSVAIERYEVFTQDVLQSIEPQLAFNTAASFTTNTNWQNYTGEQTMSYLTQMAGLAFHQFVSAAAGIALAVALVRGLARRSAQHLGSFWVDLVRGTLYILLPICIVVAIIFVSQGMVQNFNAYTVVHTLNGQTQTIAQGPVASMEVIKDLGTNGGGFFNVNAAHPFENPNALTALLIILCEITLGAGLFYMFGKWVGNAKQGWVLWIVSAILFIIGVFIVIPAEQTGNPILTSVGANQVVSATQPGGNMEGKEARFGITISSLQEVTTTATSTGTVMSFHDTTRLWAGWC